MAHRPICRFFGFLTVVLPSLGGSILSSLSTFQTEWYTKEMYDECGSRMVSVMNCMLPSSSGRVAVPLQPPPQHVAAPVKQTDEEREARRQYQIAEEKRMAEEREKIRLVCPSNLPPLFLRQPKILFSHFFPLGVNCQRKRITSSQRSRKSSRK